MQFFCILMVSENNNGDKMTAQLKLNIILLSFKIVIEETTNLYDKMNFLSLIKTEGNETMTWFNELYNESGSRESRQRFAHQLVKQGN